MHGGKSLVGAASPTFTTGRYSKYLPQRLTERYQQAVQDTELLALREEVALLDARLADLLSRVDAGESGQMWQQANKAFLSVMRFYRARDYKHVDGALFDLEQALEGGLNDYLAWEELRQIVDQRRKLVESERKRLVEMQQVITAEQAMVLVTTIVDSVRKHVRDRDALAAISDDIRRIALARGAQAPPA